MEVIFHPQVRRDVLEVLQYYRTVSPELADEFQNEFRATIAKAVGNPNRYHLIDGGFRRANLKRFPYHVLYETHHEAIRIMIVRHNKRHPDFGRERN